MKLIRFVLCAVAFAGVATTAIRAQGMSSPNYRIPTCVVAAGGGGMASANYQLVATVGEPIVGASTGPNTILNAGFIATLVAIIGTRGDVNRDGVINSDDVKMILKVTAGIKSSGDSDFDYPNADVEPSPTSDGQITLRDAARVLRYINGLYPAGL